MSSPLSRMVLIPLLIAGWAGCGHSPLENQPPVQNQELAPEEKLGVEEASYLMDRPAGGWSDLVTNHTLDLKFEVLDARFDARLGERRDARSAGVNKSAKTPWPVD